MQDLVIKRNNPIKNGQKTWIDISSGKTYAWPIGMIRCSLSLAMHIEREMQIKTTERCHLIPARTAINKKSDGNDCW